MSWYQDNFLNELIVDNFAGGGGASIGIELAVGRPVDIALIRANLADMAYRKPLHTVKELNDAMCG